MTAQSASTASSSSTSSNFRSRMKAGVSDLLKGTGALTQTADTGQIDLVSGTFSPVVNTVGGYEIFYLNDALHATKPVYIKIEYGWGQADTANPQLWLTIGSGSNGAGTLTGNLSSRRVVLAGQSTAWGSNTAHMCYANGAAADSAIVWAGWWGGASYAGVMGGGLFIVERQRDPDGAPNGNGVYITTAGLGEGGTNTDCLRLTPTGLTHAATTRAGLLLPTWSNTSGSTTGIVGADTYFCPVLTGFHVQSFGSPSKYLLGYNAGDVSRGVQQSVSLYGAAKTFLCGGANWSQFDLTGAGSGWAPAVRIN
jgi:hypothetical protein